jgi:hypothetical protein
MAMMSFPQITATAIADGERRVVGSGRIESGSAIECKICPGAAGAMGSPVL